jgi:hypothetical protein
MRSFIWGLTPLLLSGAAHAAESAALQPGRYEVQMRLELPHVEDMGVSKTVNICVNARARSP